MFLRVLALILGLGLFGAVHAEGTLADVHTEMGGCENCHASEAPKEGEVDGAQVNETCIGCHGAAEEIEGDHHATHGDMLSCNDCHAVHELAADAKPSCDECHDDGAP